MQTHRHRGWHWLMGLCWLLAGLAGATTPAAQSGKTVVFLADDLRNGGVLGVAQGVKEAAARIGWRLQILDAKGRPDELQRLLLQVLASPPDGLILGGMDALQLQRQVPAWKASTLPTVGWHVGERPGPMPGTPVRLNVSTSPDEVARAAARLAIAQAQGRAQVVIVTDPRFAIARRKARLMAEEIRRCAGCRLLGIFEVRIADSARDTPQLVQRLLQQYPQGWTHFLAINDIYFDHATPSLAVAGVPLAGTLSCISAGDGSATAFMRIRAGTYQTATVAEPLNVQGWQLVDELNRLLADAPLSGEAYPPQLVTAAQSTPSQTLGDYRQRYTRLWGLP